MSNSKTGALFEAHRAHLRASGLTDETITAAGFYSVTDAVEAARILGRDGKNLPVPAAARAALKKAGY